ncbi:MAG: HdeD family acid-resistance protein [Armatimonadetes bacterium]|nr:MAG: HdeD family acid-resistance protein [Armatimonadota bacterium]
MADTHTDVEVYDPVSNLKRSWWVLVISGVLSVAIGVALIFWPGQTLTVATALFGALMILSGIVRFLQAVFSSETDHRWLLLISAILGVVIGVVVIRNPESVIALIVLLAALFWIIGGMVDLFRGLTDESLPDRGARIGLGVISGAFGVVILIWPAPTVLVFAILAGAYSILFGLLEIYAGIALKRA